MDRADVDGFEKLAPEMLRGRFDILVKSEAAKTIVGLESKVWARFGKNQLLKYRRRLDHLRRSLRLRRCYLISLTASGQEPEGVDAHFRWSVVQGSLEMAADACRSPGSFLGGVCKLFAAFLKEKGLAPMKILNPTGEMLRGYLDAMKFRETMEKILVSLKEYSHLRRLFERKQVIFNSQPDDDEEWVGIYGRRRRRNPSFYVGFGMCNVSRHPKLYLVVEMTMSGDMRRPARKIRPRPIVMYEPNPVSVTWLRFERLVDGGAGKTGEDVRDWFVDTSETALGWAKGLTKKNS